MAASSAGKFTFKQRAELDAMLDAFEGDLARKREELNAHFSAYADIILSMTSADDDQYVCNRLDSILRGNGLPGDAPAPKAP
jgi:hypothetical protein